MSVRGGCALACWTLAAILVCCEGAPLPQVATSGGAVSWGSMPPSSPCVKCSRLCVPWLCVCASSLQHPRVCAWAFVFVCCCRTDDGAGPLAAACPLACLGLLFL